MNREQKLVQEWHEKFEVPVGKSPRVVDKSVMSLRVSLIQEELNEFAKAGSDGDIVKVADALADLLYVVDPHTGETEGEDPGTHPLQMHPQRDEMSRQKSREVDQSRQQRQSQETFAGRGSATQSSPPTPGTTGRPGRSRPAQRTESNVDLESVEEGLQTGSSRAVRISKPNRKKRIA